MSAQWRRPSAAPGLQRYASMLKPALFIALLAVTSFSAIAGGSKGCFEMSSVKEGECLRKELAEEEKLLARALASLRSGIGGQTFWSTNPEMDRNAKQRLFKALSDADGAWKRLVATECGELLDGSYIGGNGGLNAGLSCEIDRTRSRILEMKWSDSYRWMLTK